MIHDPSKSRLSSISQQSNEHDNPTRTQQALLNVYHQLYLIDHVPLPAEPRHVAKGLSQKVQRQLPNFYTNVQWESAVFREANVKSVSNKFFNYIKSSNQSEVSLYNSRILSPQELTDRIKEKLFESQNKTAATQTMQHSDSKIKYGMNSQLDQTTQETQSLSSILTKLSHLDEQRTNLKFQIYSQQPHKMQNLYLKWTSLHQKMKQVLQIYINKIGNGKSLLELYNDLDNLKSSKKVVEGFSERELLLKLDVYLQSLFLDQREILLYRSASEKSRSVRTGKGVRKMLVYN